MNKPSVAISTWLEQFMCRAVQRGCDVGAMPLSRKANRIVWSAQGTLGDGPSPPLFSDEGVAATYSLAVFCNSYTK